MAAQNEMICTSRDSNNDVDGAHCGIIYNSGLVACNCYINGCNIIVFIIAKFIGYHGKSLILSCLLK